MPDLKFDPTDGEHVIEIGKWEVENEEVLHLKNLYKVVHNWLMTHKFTSLDLGDAHV